VGSQIKNGCLVILAWSILPHAFLWLRLLFHIEEHSITFFQQGLKDVMINCGLVGAGPVLRATGACSRLVPLPCGHVKMFAGLERDDRVMSPIVVNEGNVKEEKGGIKQNEN